jgi:MFS family permease
MIRPSFTHPEYVFAVVILVNFLNYVDRGVIPGANDEFVRFISSSLATKDPDVFLGLLQSSFIVGFTAVSLIFGHLVHYYGPFVLISFGLSLWLLATILCGIGFTINSFHLLLIARMLSGAGEASFNCSLPPWIAKHAPEGKKGTWLALYYTAIPVGMAVGYPYAAIVGGFAGCQWVFFAESIAMLPCIVYLSMISPYYPCDEGAQQQDGKTEGTTTDDLHQPLLTDLERPKHNPSETDEICDRNLHKSDGKISPPTVAEEFRSLISCPMYLCIVAG